MKIGNSYRSVLTTFGAVIFLVSSCTAFRSMQRGFNDGVTVQRSFLLSSSLSSRVSFVRIPHHQILYATVPGSSSSSSEIKNDDSNGRGGDDDAALFQLINDNKNDAVSASDDLDCVAAPESGILYNQLRTKLDNLEKGIGKRYKTHTQQGFLNIHKEPTDPFDTSNIVGKLKEGQIVTSTGPKRGDWILHDGGGWSIVRFQGFQWLELIQD